MASRAKKPASSSRPASGANLRAARILVPKLAVMGRSYAPASHTRRQERAASLHAPQQVPQLLLLRLQVAAAVLGRSDLDRHPLGDRQAVAFEAHELARVVRHQAQLVDAQLDQDLGAD